MHSTSKAQLLVFSLPFFSCALQRRFTRILVLPCHPNFRTSVMPFVGFHSFCKFYSLLPHIYTVSNLISSPRGPQKEPTLPISWSQISSSKNCEKINLCCLSHPVCVLSYSSPSKLIQRLSHILVQIAVSEMSWLMPGNLVGTTTIWKTKIDIHVRVIKYREIM